MKNILKIVPIAIGIATGIFSFSQGYAQTHKDSTLGHKINKDATQVGHATAHAAASGASMVVDKKYKGKCGPQGQTIYINKYSHYYYISKKGHRVYLKKAQLMDKPM
jgi:hypothetical protein